jgi:hypothetical protein
MLTVVFVPYAGFQFDPWNADLMQAQLDHAPWALPGGDRSSWSIFDPLHSGYGGLHASPLPNAALLPDSASMPGAAGAPCPAVDETLAAKPQHTVEGDGQLSSPPVSCDGKLLLCPEEYTTAPLLPWVISPSPKGCRSVNLPPGSNQFSILPEDIAHRLKTTIWPLIQL